MSLVEQLFVIMLPPDYFGLKKSLIRTCILCVSALGVCGKTRFLVCGFVATGLLGCTGFVVSGRYSSHLFECVRMWYCDVFQEIPIGRDNLGYHLVVRVICRVQDGGVLRWGILCCSGFVQKMVSVHSSDIDIGFLN